jgi:hypothetical protein
MSDVAMGITSGDIVEAVAGAFGQGVSGKFYRYAPSTYTDTNLVLEKENYVDTKKWQEVRPDVQLSGSEVGLKVTSGQLVRTQDGRWFQRSGSDITITAAAESFDTTKGWTQISSMKSDRGMNFAFTLSDDFYVVKPKDMALPKLVYANVANQLFEDRAKIIGWKESHAGNAEAIARYDALLEQIDAQLQKMGLAEKDAKGNVMPRSSFDQLFLQMPSIKASGGGIYIEADTAANKPSKLSVDAAFKRVVIDAIVKLVTRLHDVDHIALVTITSDCLVDSLSCFVHGAESRQWIQNHIHANRFQFLN